MNWQRNKFWLLPRMKTQNKPTGWGISFIEQTEKYGKIKIFYTVRQKEMLSNDSSLLWKYWTVILDSCNWMVDSHASHVTKYILIAKDTLHLFRVAMQQRDCRVDYIHRDQVPEVIPNALRSHGPRNYCTAAEALLPSPLTWPICNVNSYPTLTSTIFCKSSWAAFPLWKIKQ